MKFIEEAVSVNSHDLLFPSFTRTEAKLLNPGGFRPIKENLTQGFLKLEK